MSFHQWKKSLQTDPPHAKALAHTQERNTHRNIGMFHRNKEGHNRQPAMDIFHCKHQPRRKVQMSN